jgi:hypothetical protein
MNPNYMIIYVQPLYQKKTLVKLKEEYEREEKT